MKPLLEILSTSWQNNNHHPGQPEICKLPTRRSFLKKDYCNTLKIFNPLPQNGKGCNYKEKMRRWVSRRCYRHILWKGVFLSSSFPTVKLNKRVHKVQTQVDFYRESINCYINTLHKGRPPESKWDRQPLHEVLAVQLFLAASISNLT